MSDEASPTAATAPRRRPKKVADPEGDAPRTSPPAKEKETSLAPKTKSSPAEEAEAPRSPKRPTLDAATARALWVRDETDRRRPLFVRQAAHRYARIGRDGAWRRPRGLQSKQRRHYGYRPTVVSIGYRSPARARGLVPSGFRPIVVRTTQDLAAVDALKEAVYIARTVGTRRRLVLEEAARKLGIHILNPIATPQAEE